MNRISGRLLRPTTWYYYVMMFAFGVTAIVLRYYLLAGIALLVSTIMLVIHLSIKKWRRKQLKDFLDKRLTELEGTKTKPPFPMVAIRLHDGGIIFANGSFVQLTGFQDILDLTHGG